MYWAGGKSTAASQTDMTTPRHVPPEKLVPKETICAANRAGVQDWRPYQRRGSHKRVFGPMRYGHLNRLWTLTFGFQSPNLPGVHAGDDRYFTGRRNRRRPRGEGLFVFRVCGLKLVLHSHAAREVCFASKPLRYKKYDSILAKGPFQ